MIIAIATDRADSNQYISENFGRSQWFYLYNTGTKDAWFVKNTAALEEQNAGINTVDFLLGLNINMVISLRFGTKTTIKLREENIQIVIPLAKKRLIDIVKQLAE